MSWPIRHYRVRTFKSGNSLAVRLPKALGLKEGAEVVVVPHEGGSFSFWPENEGANILDGLYGAFSKGFMSEGRVETEQEERDWSAPARDAAA